MTKTTHRQRQILLCIAMSWVCQAASGAQQQESSDLSDLFRQFQSVTSLHFVAELEIFIQPTAEGDSDMITRGVPISAELQYWAQGDLYRHNSYADPQYYQDMQMQVAYDGNRYQRLFSGGILQYSAQERLSLNPVLINPLLQMLQFRYPLTDDNPEAMQLRLKDVRTDRVPAEFFQRAWTITEEGGRRLEMAIFPGGTFDGHTYTTHVYATPGARNRPVHIDRVTAQGLVTTSTFSDYLLVETADGPTYWPRSVELRSFDSQGREMARASFTISVLEVNSGIAPEVFVIDPAGAKRIFDEDRQEFVNP